jgi:hypothetical protein
MTVMALVTPYRLSSCEGVPQHGLAVGLVLHAGVQVLREHRGGRSQGPDAAVRVPPQRTVLLQVPLPRQLRPAQTGR